MCSSACWCHRINAERADAALNEAGATQTALSTRAEAEADLIKQVRVHAS